MDKMTNRNSQNETHTTEKASPISSWYNKYKHKNAITKNGQANKNYYW